MLANSITLMFWTVLIMGSLCSLGVIGGLIIAKVRERRYLKVFHEDSYDDDELS